jgi:hypothetical protein
MNTITTPDDFSRNLAPDPRVRVIGTDGNFYRIPQEHVPAAVEAGGRVMTPDDMRALRQTVFMEHGIFKEAHKKPEGRRQRKSLLRRSAR